MPFGTMIPVSKYEMVMGVSTPAMIPAPTVSAMVKRKVSSSHSSRIWSKKSRH